MPTLEVSATETYKVVHRELNKKYEKYLLLIDQCMDSNIFDKIVDEETIEGVWDTLKKSYGGNEKLKNVKFQSLRKRYMKT